MTLERKGLQKVRRRGCNRPARDTERKDLRMYGQRTRAGQARPIDLDALVGQVSAAAGAPKITLPPRELDRRGHRRPDQCQPGYRAGVKPPNRGKSYPPNLLTVEDCFALLSACDTETVFGRRLFFGVLFTWRGAFRASEALAVTKDDLDRARGRVTIRHGKGGKRRTVAIDKWAWPLLQPWLTERETFPPGPLICVVDGPTAGRGWRYPDFLFQLHQLAQQAGVERRTGEPGEYAGKRCALHQLRHSWAGQSYLAGVPIRTVQLQLGHSNLGVTDQYLRALGLDSALDELYEQAEPTIPATAMLALAGLSREVTRS